MVVPFLQSTISLDTSSMLDISWIIWESLNLRAYEREFSILSDFFRYFQWIFLEFRKFFRLLRKCFRVPEKRTALPEGAKPSEINKRMRDETIRRHRVVRGGIERKSGYFRTKCSSKETALWLVGQAGRQADGELASCAEGEIKPSNTERTNEPDQQAGTERPDVKDSQSFSQPTNKQGRRAARVIICSIDHEEGTTEKQHGPIQWIRVLQLSPEQTSGEFRLKDEWKIAGEYRSQRRLLNKSTLLVTLRASILAESGCRLEYN